MRINEKTKALAELRRRVPYCLVVHVGLRKIAAFNRDYRLITSEFGAGDFSKAIVHLEKNAVEKEHGYQFTYEWQHPRWMTKEIRNDCITYFVWEDGSTIHHLRAAGVALGVK